LVWLITFWTISNSFLLLILFNFIIV
jgi:hypothetical protein